MDLQPRVLGALQKLGQDTAPAQPEATPKPPASRAQLTSLAQTLAQIPQPLRSAMRKTVAAPSAHVTISGRGISGRGDYSTVQHIGAFRMRFFCFGTDEVIDGTTSYMRSSFPGPGRKANSRKWVKQDLKDMPAAARSGFPRAQLLTFAEPLAMLSGAGHVSDLGRQMIDGVETTHYRTHLNLLNGLPSIERRQMKDMSSIDVWVNPSDGYIRRAHIGFGGLDETVNISRIGEHVHVTIPPADRTVDFGAAPGHGKLTLSSVGSTSLGSTGCAKP
jgi:hypothetical protein